MEQLKHNIEKLNNLYYKLNGFFCGVVANLEKNNVNSEEFDYFFENLNPDYTGSYLEEVDEYVIEKINHCLEDDAYIFSETASEFIDLELRDLFEKARLFNSKFLRDLRDIEHTVYAIDSKIPSFGICCEGLRSVADQMDESLSVLKRYCCPVCCKQDNMAL